jgi:hypothetical protein
VIRCAIAAAAAASFACHGAAAAPRIFFDDFSHADTTALQAAGWLLRSGTGHPGVTGARWAPEAITLLDDPAQRGNRLLRLTARTDGNDGPGTQQAQLCHQRKVLRGTYAARVRFSDTPAAGRDGDPIIQTFYVVAPLQHDFDPQFSEVDWEYLPNGGWGSERQRLYGISWQTVRLDPWTAHNSAHEEFRSFDGWHVLLMQVEEHQVRMFVDGHPVARHAGLNLPVVPMSIAFNLWFSPAGLLPDNGEPRVYTQDVDWVFHAADRSLGPAQVDAEVRRLRRAGTAHMDTVPSPHPALESRCDF